ncbi:16S rRNA (cytosine(1402)-N(4))-methyltransferase RsmH [Bacteriovorax sp. PP10]|uniref:Ribosomal RNA small subunit methyltransferase H n=1 Tax=Bacteriovorax antarcticus TaxID=3088717 RepID=A0ABU5VP66_9BACT|nr:16S rRNA (cytosine(1402)-N(4))-methyltransferase RsmH [Bacteriovorax sp. PP10]MEA9354732.1 16S rRNA (cytosine(1402)-N(4))-methyltransferase RsmH [Bacteriovorax sp. PP10]
MSYGSHYTVLKKECIDTLTEKAPTDVKSYYADLTFGGGGHSFEFLYRNPLFNVRSTDQDPDALKNGNARIESEGMLGRIKLINTNFVHFAEMIREHSPEVFEAGGFQGILLDLGVSSHHFDEATRGFSFRFDGPLDMRMNHESDEFLTAAEIVNTYDEKDLKRIFEEYGEEKNARKIAMKIVEERKVKSIETTKELENIVFHCYPKEHRYGKTNPSTRVFQALRLEVNRELEVLSNTITQLIPLLKMNGRIAIISFHSLEDRIVKNVFRDSMALTELPVEVLTKKPILPTEEEISHNSRSRSAKLRILERIEVKKDKNKYKY